MRRDEMRNMKTGDGEGEGEVDVTNSDGTRGDERRGVKKGIAERN